MATLSNRIDQVATNILTAKQDLRQAILDKEGTVGENPTFAELKQGIENIQSGAIRTYNKENLEDYSQGFSAIPYYLNISGNWGSWFGRIWDFSNTIYIFNGDDYLCKYNLDSSTQTQLDISIYDIFGIWVDRIYHFNYPDSKNKILSCAFYSSSGNTPQSIVIFDLTLCTFSTLTQFPYNYSVPFTRQSYPDYIYGYCFPGNSTSAKLFKINIVSKVSTDLLTDTSTTDYGEPQHYAYTSEELIPNNNEKASYLIIQTKDNLVKLINLNRNTYTTISDQGNNRYIQRTIKGYTFLNSSGYNNYSMYKVKDFTSNSDCVGIEGVFSTYYEFKSRYLFIHNSPFCLVSGRGGASYVDFLARLPRYMLPVYPGCSFSFDKTVFKEYSSFSRQSKIGTYFSNTEIIDPNTETVAEKGYYYYIIDPKPTGYIKYI